MRFKTLEEFDKELDEMEKDLHDMESYLKNHPEKFGTKGNYETYRYAYNILKEDRIIFIEKVNTLNLKLTGKLINGSLNVNDFTQITNKINEIQNLTTNLLFENNINEDLLVKELSEWSYKITFAFPNPTEEDVKRKTPRKKGLLKIFDFIRCGEDIEKLKKEAGPKGNRALIKYKEFLQEIIKLDADFTLDTECGNLNAGLSVEQCIKICENLNV